MIDAPGIPSNAPKPGITAAEDLSDAAAFIGARLFELTRVRAIRIREINSGVGYANGNPESQLSGVWTGRSHLHQDDEICRLALGLAEMLKP